MNHWNAKLYDNAHGFVSKYGQDVLELLNPQPKEHILDLGCGTGDIAYKLQQMNVDVIGVDHSENMIEQACEKYPDVHFQVKNIVALDYTNQFDAVFSNAVLHWVKQSKDALEQIYESLKTGGRFVAEFGGEDNVRGITTALSQARTEIGYPMNATNSPWYFPSIGSYTSLMERVGFRVEFAELIDRPTKLVGKDGLRQWLHMFSEHFFHDLEPEEQEQLICNVEKLLKPNQFDHDHWIADYKRLRVKAVKTS